MQINFKQKNGYTLIELLLYIGIVAVLSISAYNFYGKKQVDTTAYTMSKNMEQIDKSVSTAYSTVAGFSTLNNAFAIASNLVPTELISGSNIVNMFGGNLTLGSATVAGNPAYSITIDKLPSYACIRMATSLYASRTQEVEINGSIVKTSGGPLTSAQIASAAAQCNSNLNTIIYRNTLLSPYLDSTGSATPIRGKENPYYIATIGSPSTAGSPSCASTSTWNGSFCSCPTGSEWNGSACIVFGTATPQPGWCPRGQGWTPSTKTCAALPNGSSSNAYTNGRNIPGSVTVPTIQTVIGGATLPVAGSEVVAGRTITWGVGQADDMTVQTCVNGAWDPTSKRCVTP